MKWVLVAVAVAVCMFIAYAFWSTDQDAHAIVDAFRQSGVITTYDCDRSAPSITVAASWDQLQSRTQRGVLAAVQMVCATTDHIVVRRRP